VTSAPPFSPCTKLCVLDDKSGFCLGCGRTIEEITAWPGMNSEQRQRVMALLPERLAKLKALPT
jgi:predicted Fe-S protein YdhL (DUF1289 family)